MLIIDQHTDSKLIQAIEALKTQDNHQVRCLHFKLAGKLGAAEEAHRHIIDSAGRHIASANPELYMCESGDVFILAPSLPGKPAKQIMLDVATQLQLPVTDEFAGLYELDFYANRILSLMEQAVEKRRQEAEIQRKEREAQQAERKRQSILDCGSVSERAHDLAARRSSRGKPELMIIEDDAFSCRLVENVLRERYALTALGTAEQALATYVHLAPDLLFLDIDLPDVTGQELLERIIALDPQAYIIMLSGNSDQANIMQSLKNGAKGFVAKPFTRDKLFQYIDRCPTIRH